MGHFKLLKYYYYMLEYCFLISRIFVLCLAATVCICMHMFDLMFIQQYLFSLNVFNEHTNNCLHPFNRFTESIPAKSELRSELEQLWDHLSTLNSPVVFCHNDLLPANIIYNREKGKLLNNGVDTRLTHI